MKSIKDQIKEKSVSGAYLIYGEEDYLKDFYTDSIVKLCTEEGPVEFNMLKINNEKIDNDKIAEFMLSFPFMADKKVLVIKNSGIFAKASESDVKFWLDTLSNLPEYGVVVFCENDVDKRKSLYKAMASKHTVEEFPLQKEAELISWFARRLASGGKKMTKEDISFVIENVGTSMYLLIGEAEKLIAYTKDTEELISRKAVEECICRNLEGRIFELVDNIVAGKSEKVIQGISDLKTLKEQPLVLVALIFRQYSLLRKIKVLQKDYSVYEIASRTKTRDFVVKKHISTAKKFSLDALDNALFLCKGADDDIKGGLCEPWLVVEKLATALMGVGR